MDIIKRQITSIAKNMEKLSPHTLLKGLKNSMATSGNNMACPQKVTQSYHMTK